MTSLRESKQKKSEASAELIPKSKSYESNKGYS
jgi:hypothetical protein